MMRFTQAINFAIAGVLVVPAVTLQGEQSASLRQALQRTVQSIEQLTGMRQSFRAEERTQVAAVRAASERSLPAGPERDQRLFGLRNDVSRLQSNLDLLEAAQSERERALGVAPPLAPEPRPTLPVAPSADGQATLPLPGVATTGLDHDLRAALGDIRIPAPDPAQVDGAPPRPRSREEAGYSADTVLEGRALYRAGRYEECIAVLAGRLDDTRALAWNSRALAKLGAHEEALAGFRKVLEMGADGFEAERVRDDIAFLEWKLSFAERIQRGSAQREKGSRP